MQNVIDTDNYSASGIEVFAFAGGEWHANVPKWRTEAVHVHAKLRTWDDVGKLLVVTSALHTQGVRVYLFVPYFPGLRQDRNPEGLTPLTSQIYGQVLRHAAYEMTTVDPHSLKGLNWAQSGSMRAIHTIDPVVFLPDLIQDKPTHILCPDNGAKARAEATAELFGAKVIYASKKRNFETGALEGFHIPGILPPLTQDDRVLIADDICDGGGTFIGLMSALREQTTITPVDLYVTHGIFSKGLDPLAAFDRVYTTDSFYQPTYTERHPLERVQYVDLLPYYFGGLRP